MRCDGIRTCNASIDGRWRRSDSRKPTSRRRGSWGFVLGGQYFVHRDKEQMAKRLIERLRNLGVVVEVKAA